MAYFTDVLFPEEFSFTDQQIKVINKKLIDGNKTYLDEIEAYIILGNEDYINAFSESYSAGTKKREEQASKTDINTDNLPF